MPTDELTGSGLTLLTASIRLDQIIDQLRAEIDSLLRLSANDPTGQVVRILVDFVQRNAELLQTIATAMDPDQASGVVLTAQSTITGTNRKPATQGSVLLKVTLDGGTTLPAGSLAWSQLSEDTTVATDIDVVAPAGPSDDYYVTATVVAYGEIAIPAGVVKDIKTPVSGWTAVVNESDGTPGQEAETDEELRERREAEVAGGGSTNAKALKAALTALEGVDQAIVLENDRPISQDGMPPNSIEAIVRAPSVSDSTLADVIYEKKAGGNQAWGTTIVDYYDEDNNLHKIGFTRALEREIDLEYTLVTDDDYPGPTAFKAAIAAWADSNLGIGDDVIYSQFISLAFCEVDGVLNVTQLRLRFTGDAWGTSDLSIGTREIADIDTSRITVL